MIGLLFRVYLAKAAQKQCLTQSLMEKEEHWRYRIVLTIPIHKAEKWNSVLQEPENAKLLSELGLLTIPEYEIMVATINGQELPALSMTPFSDLPFRVFDSKDGTQTYTHGPLSHIEHFSDISSYITGFGADIATLTQSGIILSRDSISFAALPDGSMRLFFYDLQDMTINNSTNKDNLRAGYSGLIVSMLDNIFDYQACV